MILRKEITNNNSNSKSNNLNGFNNNLIINNNRINKSNTQLNNMNRSKDSSIDESLTNNVTKTKIKQYTTPIRDSSFLNKKLEKRKE